MHRATIGALAATVAIGVAGCGGSDGTLTRAEFVRQANAVCAKADAQARKKEARTDGIERSALLLAVSQAIKAEQIGALRPPTGLQTSFEQYKQILQERKALYARVLENLHAKRPIGVTAPETIELQTRERELARGLKLTRCAE